MALAIRDAEVVAITEATVTVAFTVEDDGRPSDAPATVRIGAVAADSGANPGHRLVRVAGLAAATDHTVAVDVAGAEPPPRDDRFPATVRTLPAPAGALVASFATMNDLHVGEVQFGGVPGIVNEVLLASDTEVPYWRFMNEDAIAEINDAGVDAVIIKGDIADRGLRDQLLDARELLGRLRPPWHAFMGNHDTYGRWAGEHNDGYALLDQPPLPRAIDLAGWRLLLIDSVVPGQHSGRLPPERLAWLADALADTARTATPTIILMHHQPVPPEFAHGMVNSIGIAPADSVQLFTLLGAHPHVAAVLCGHTHRNRIRRYPESGRVPFVEVQSTKDYPGGWAHYRLYDDGTMRQETRRTSSPRALAHSGRCSRMFGGQYLRYAIGTLADRCFTT